MQKENFCIAVPSLAPDVKEQIKALWTSAFGDDNEYIDRAFGTFLKDALCFYTLCDGNVACVFFTIPAHFKYPEGLLRAFYLYAATTKEALRGKGLFSELFLFAKELLGEKHSADFIFLVPASEELFGFYRSLSFVDTSFYKKEEIKSEDYGYNFTRQESVPETLYGIYRKNSLSFPNALLKSRELFGYSLRDKMLGGYDLYLFDGGFLLERGGEIYHLCTESSSDVRSVCASFGAFAKREAVSAKLFSSDGKPFCMALPLGEKKVANVLCSLLFE